MNGPKVTPWSIGFVTGFIKDGKALGRPVGVAVEKSGALVVADDVGNTVWRVTAASNPG